MINFVNLYIYISKKNVYEWFYECNISKKKKYTDYDNSCAN